VGKCAITWGERGGIGRESASAASSDDGTGNEQQGASGLVAHDSDQLALEKSPGTIRLRHQAGKRKPHTSKAWIVCDSRNAKIRASRLTAAGHQNLQFIFPARVKGFAVFTNDQRDSNNLAGNVFVSFRETDDLRARPPTSPILHFQPKQNESKQNQSARETKQTL